jgi:hypothetical protein
MSAVDLGLPSSHLLLLLLLLLLSFSLFLSLSLSLSLSLPAAASIFPSATQCCFFPIWVLRVPIWGIYQIVAKAPYCGIIIPVEPLFYAGNILLSQNQMQQKITAFSEITE